MPTRWIAILFGRIQADLHPELIGASPAVRRLKELIDRVAGSDTAVVIEGERVGALGGVTLVPAAD